MFHLKSNFCPKGHFLVLWPTIRQTKTNTFKSSENFQKKEGGPDLSVSNYQFSSVTLNGLAMRTHTVISNFNKAVNPKTEIGSEWQISV